MYITNITNYYTNRYNTGFYGRKFPIDKVCADITIKDLVTRKPNFFSKIRKKYYNQDKNTVIPKVFPTPPLGSQDTVFNVYSENMMFKYFTPSKKVFSQRIEPKTLERIYPNPKEQVIHVSNFDYPRGTISASTTLDKCICTDELQTCAAVAIVDKSKNIQTLIHMYNGQSARSNSELLEYLLSFSKPENMEISIVPGRESDTGRTIAFIVDEINKFAKDAKLNFYNFPPHSEDINGVRILKRTLVLKDGKLYCCNINEIKNKKVNPKESICYFKPYYESNY